MHINKTKRFITHFWKEDAGLTSMLVIIFITNFLVQPLFNESSLIRYINEYLFLTIILSGIWILIEKTRNKILWTLAPLTFFILTKIEDLNFGPLFTGPKIFLITSTFFILIYLVMKKVFEPGPVSFHKIVGAILAFMLLGNLWANFYDSLYFYDTSAYSFSTPITLSQNTHFTFIYFSFSTLTTTGYGDIVPVSPFARSLVMIEQLIGILYPVVLIGRLISLNTSTQSNSDSK
ncbi:MAG: hypothetical protein CFE21_11865 [Bacteroidetes bacterium B1(2017)]|nr:MAG: hypothetical protein CFE21_11865 [Bacteroidetes bacterium B1(2017)]